MVNNASYCGEVLLLFKVLHLLFVELTFEKLTVGKIYAGLLIVENWKAFKQGVQPTDDQAVSESVLLSYLC